MHNVELIRLDGVANPLATSAVAEKPNLAGVTRLFQCFYHFAGLKYFHCTTVQMNDIQVIRFESLKALFDRSLNGR